MFYILIIIAALLAAIACLVSSINRNLGKISSSRAIESEISSLSEVVANGSAATVDAIVGIDLKLQEIESHIRDIHYVTDLIEKYKLPAEHEREILDQVRLDQEIDSIMRR